MATKTKAASARNCKTETAKSPKSYLEKLRDPRWQKMRLQIMERDGFKCRECHSDSGTLNVHHRFYRKGAAPWEYEPQALVTLCEKCHELQERRKQIISEAIGGPSQMQEIVMRVIQMRSGDGPFSHPAFEYIVDCLHEFAGEFECAMTAGEGTEQEAEENLRKINLFF